MALADIPYLTATWTAPSSDLTDYVGYFDLSNAPQTWWDEVDTSDGTKLRVAKDDAAEGSTSATELAFEVVDFDDTAETGLLWFRWSGTLASTSPDDLRIYPAKASASSYGVTDTFGRNAVWTDMEVTHHMDSVGDASGNGYSLTIVNDDGGLGTTGGVVGDYADLDSSEYYSISPPSTDASYTVLAWAQFRDSSGNDFVYDNDVGINLEPGIGLLRISGEDFFIETSDGSNYESGRGSIIADDTWAHFGVVVDRSVDQITGYLDGASDITINISGLGSVVSTATTYLGRQGGSSPSNIWEDEMWVVNRALPADWIALEYANQNNVGTFWSSITLDNTGGGETLEMDAGSFSVTGYTLLQNLSTPLDNGTFSLTGYGLFQNLSVPLANGSFNFTGYDITFGLSIPIENGTLSQTGYDLVFNRSVPLDNQSFSLTGHTLNLNLSVPLNKGTFSLTGYDLLFDEGDTIVMGKGTFNVDGKDLSFQFTHPIDKGSFSVNGYGVNFNTSVPLEKASFNLDGQLLSFKQVIALNNGSFDLTGYDLIFDAVENIIILSGKSLITDITGSSAMEDIEGKSLIKDIEGESSL